MWAAFALQINAFWFQGEVQCRVQIIMLIPAIHYIGGSRHYLKRHSSGIWNIRSQRLANNPLQRCAISVLPYKVLRLLQWNVLMNFSDISKPTLSRDRITLTLKRAKVTSFVLKVKKSQGASKDDLQTSWTLLMSAEISLATDATEL